jgi:hypothetical protein
MSTGRETHAVLPRPGAHPASTVEAGRCWRLVYSRKRLRRLSSLSDEVVNVDKELAGGCPRSPDMGSRCSPFGQRSPGMLERFGDLRIGETHFAGPDRPTSVLFQVSVSFHLTRK